MEVQEPNRKSCGDPQLMRQRGNIIFSWLIEKHGCIVQHTSSVTVEKGKWW